jgi:hypothetical protein
MSRTARDLIPIMRHDAEVIEGVVALLVLLVFVSLAVGTAAWDLTRLFTNLVAPG